MQGEMVVAVASPSSAPPSAGRLHPTYKEMILQALTELRDPSGSSRSAIANYIAGHFSGLHSRHDALLSVHLRSLKSHGQLRLVSGNYFVSSSPPKPAPGQKRGRGRPRKNPDLAPSASIPAFQGPKRGRGRPRKNALVPVPVASSPSPLQGASAPPPPSGVKRGRGRPRKDALVPLPSSSSPLLGATDPPPPSGIKRGRGRPRKNAPVRSSLSHLLGAIALPPPPSGIKRSRGRPRKNAPVRSSLSHLLGVIAPPPPPSGVKRSRGRPRKKAPVRSSSSQLLGAIAPPPPSGVKRGRGRPRKDAYPAVAPLLGGEQGPADGQPQTNTTPLSQPPATVPHSGKSRPFRLLRVAVDISALRGSSMSVSACSNNTVVDAKRGRGRPPKAVVAGKDNMQPEFVQSADASLTKRGRGRPRKEKALENGHLKAAQMTEGQHEALTVQAADQAGAVQDEVEARDLQFLGTSLTEKKMTEGQQEALTTQSADQAGTVESDVEARDLQSLGTPLTEKRGRGRPRKRPLETKTAEAGVDASTVKRGRGRPRKEKTLETGDLKVAQMTEGTHEALPAQAEDQTGPMQNEVEARILQSLGTPLMEKRGRGRPRKRPLETETAETQVDALVKKRGRGRPRKARPFETESVETAVEVSRDLTEDGPEKDGDLVPGQKAETQDAGGVLLSEEEAAIAPMDAGGATPRIDPMDVGTKSH